MERMQVKIRLEKLFKGASWWLTKPRLRISPTSESARLAGE
jgi:hypothetical protein